MNNLKIKQLFDHETWTYTYLLWDESTKDCIIIDPVIDQINRDSSFLNKLKLVVIDSNFVYRFIILLSNSFEILSLLFTNDIINNLFSFFLVNILNLLTHLTK